MKILYINTLYAPHVGGGAEITLQTQAEGMCRAGHEVAVLTIGPKPGLHRELINGVTVWRAGFKNVYFHHRSSQVSWWRRLIWHVRDQYNRSMRSYVRDVVDQFEPDVASCHNLAGWSVVVWDVLAKKRVPIAQVLHDQYLLCAKSTMFNRGDRCNVQCVPCKALRIQHSSKSNQVTALIGVSRFIRDKLVSNGYFSKVPIREFVHNARSIEAHALPRAPRQVGNELVFGFIGTLAPNKGVELLLEAFANSSESNWRLRVAGSGLSEYEATLRARYDDSRIEFLGRVSPDDFFPTVDATVVPSVWEDTLPGVVFESLIFGKPVLGSRRGGIPEMVTVDNGILFEPTSKQIADAMKRFAASAENWRNAFSSIQAAALPYTSDLAWIARYEELFRRTIREHASRREVRDEG